MPDKENHLRVVANSEDLLSGRQADRLVVVAALAHEELRTGKWNEISGDQPILHRQGILKRIEGGVSEMDGRPEARVTITEMALVTGWFEAEENEIHIPYTMVRLDDPHPAISCLFQQQAHALQVAEIDKFSLKEKLGDGGIELLLNEHSVVDDTTRSVWQRQFESFPREVPEMDNEMEAYFAHPLAEQAIRWAQLGLKQLDAQQEVSTRLGLGQHRAHVPDAEVMRRIEELQTSQRRELEAEQSQGQEKEKQFDVEA